jgi:hypothetical protein
VKGACGIWIVLAAVCALALPREAHAYLDPGTGSMLVSALISLFVTAGFALQSYGYKLMSLFRRREPEPPQPGDARRGHEEERGSRRV